MGSSPPSEQEAVTLETVGSRLKRERLSRHQTLEDVAASTRVSINTLRALEESEYAKLPARVFVQGFIRLYAKHLGLDPEEAIAHYKKDIDETLGGKDRINVKKVLSTEAMAESPRFMSSRQILLLILIILLGTLLYIGRQTYYPSSTLFPGPETGKIPEQATQAAPEALPPTPPATEAVSPPPASAPVEPIMPEAPKPAKPTAPTAAKEHVPPVSAGATPVPETTKVAQEMQENTLKANFIERTWMWIKIDENPPQEYLFQPGEHFTWKAYKAIDINLGNAGGVELTLNGKPLPKIGISGQVVHLSMPQISKIANQSSNVP